MKEYVFFKKKDDDKVWWVDHVGHIGELLVSFDKQKVFNLFRDYPDAFTAEEKTIFDKENPYWAGFFKDR